MNTSTIKPSEVTSTVALIVGAVVALVLFATSASAAEAAYGVSYQPAFQPAPYYTQYTAQPQPWNIFWNQIDTVRYNVIDIPFNQIRQDMQVNLTYPYYSQQPTYPQQYPRYSTWDQGSYYSQPTYPAYPTYPQQYPRYSTGYPWSW
jgi:hypothetical protein